MAATTKLKTLLGIWVGLIWVGALAACTAGRATPQPTPYQPPTLAPDTTPLAQLSGAPTAAVLLPVVTPACQDNLTFLEDLSVPDGSPALPGEKLDKRWKVRNSGECNWSAAYRLRRVDGDPLGAPDELALYPARSGSEATLQIIFTAPEQPGRYRSAWQAYSPSGQPFGDPVFIELVVP